MTAQTSISHDDMLRVAKAVQAELGGQKPPFLGAAGRRMGMRVTVVHPPQPRRRSWRARLLSWPWRPWQTTEEGPQHPLWGLLTDDQAYVVADELFVTPAAYVRLMTKLAPLENP